MVNLHYLSPHAPARSSFLMLYIHSLHPEMLTSNLKEAIVMEIEFNAKLAARRRGDRHAGGEAPCGGGDTEPRPRGRRLGRVTV